MFAKQSKRSSRLVVVTLIESQGRCAILDAFEIYSTLASLAALPFCSYWPLSLDEMHPAPKVLETI
jgi:hypothetical protein